MDINDISDLPHAERVRFILEDTCGKNAMSPDLTNDDIVLSNNLATAEMLDEIHFMLRTLLKTTNSRE